MVDPAIAPYGRTVTTDAASPIERAYRPLLAPALWRTVLKVLIDLVVGSCAFALVAVPLVVAVSAVVVFPVALPFAWLALAANRVTARFDRFTIARYLGTTIPDGHRDRVPARWWSPRAAWRRFVAELRDDATWRELLYRAISLPRTALAAALIGAAFATPAFLLTCPLWVGDQPQTSIASLPLHPSAFFAGSVAFLVGLVLLPLAPIVVAGVAEGERRLGSLLLGPWGDAALAERVEEVETSRARVVDAAQAERQRIERDLHDGAQQRLVALALHLGMAKEKLATDPTAAGALVDEAHAEAKRALVELRDLARGLHPAVLTDRGLGPALSAVAARSPVPVEVDVRLTRRLDPAIEGIAYFVVCEALANVAKHARARRARVTVVQHGERVLVEVADDGLGGADPAAGTGLQGLRDRVGAVDGWIHLASPTGGPTTLTAELPCAS